MDRLALTEAYRSLGVIGCAQILSDAGVRQPAAQMVLIARFIVTELGSASPENSGAAWDSRGMRRWCHGRLVALATAPDESLDRTHWMALLVRSKLVIAWSPFRDFATLLSVRCGDDAFRRVRARLRQHGFKSQLDLLLDLRGDFVCDRLPKAMRTFDPVRGRGHETEWLSSVFYRFALQALVADATNSRHLMFLDTARTVSGTPEDDLIRAEEENVMQRIPDLLQTLTPSERSAVSLYFGTAGREASLAEIGERLGISEYRARETVTAGLMRLAVGLGVQGALDDDEYEFATEFFQQGRDPEAVAHNRNLSATDMRRRIVAKFRQALRTRTTRSEPAEERTMSYSEDLFEHEVWDDARDVIIGKLHKIRRTPRMEMKEGVVIVDLGGDYYSIDVIVQALADDPDAYTRLSREGVPLEWVLADSGYPDRADLSREFLVDQQHLHDLRNRHWDVARRICLESLERSSRHSRQFPKFDDRLIEQVSATLTSVTQALEEGLVVPIEEETVSYVIVDTDEKKVFGRWDNSPVNQCVDLRELVLDCACTVADLPKDFAEVLADVVIRALRQGEQILPGFEDALPAGGSVRLIYRLPSLEGL